MRYSMVKTRSERRGNCLVRLGLQSIDTIVSLSGNPSGERQGYDSPSVVTRQKHPSNRGGNQFDASYVHGRTRRLPAAYLRRYPPPLVSGQAVVPVEPKSNLHENKITGWNNLLFLTQPGCIPAQKTNKEAVWSVVWTVNLQALTLFKAIRVLPEQYSWFCRAPQRCLSRDKTFKDMDAGNAGLLILSQHLRRYEKLLHLSLQLINVIMRSLLRGLVISSRGCLRGSAGISASEPSGMPALAKFCEWQSTATMYTWQIIETRHKSSPA
ncbi:hypothetical protein JOM56_007967 [Amanita muscaria]